MILDLTVEYDPEHWEQLQQTFNEAFENLGSSLYNGDITNIITGAFTFAANNPLCLGLMACVFTLFGFHFFASLTRLSR